MKKLFLVLLAVLLSSTFSYSEQVKEESKAKEVQVKDTAAKTQTVEKETPTPEKKSKKAEKLTNTKTEKVSLSAVSSSASGKSGYSGNIQATQVNVEPFTGGANFAFPIPVLPGRGGIEPSIALTYSSSNRQLGTLGVGWSLELGSIQRSTKRGVPTYDDTKDTFILNFGGSVELVKGPAGTNFYYPKVEGSFSKIEKVADYWVITDKKGTQYYFGTEDTARQNDNGNQSKNFRWYLDTVGDVNGNVMKYTYIKEKNVIYPYIIKYGRSAGEISGTEIPYYAKVSFNYSPVDFNITSYMSGFEQVINKLLY